MARVDEKSLRSKVKTMYTKVAKSPHGKFHFEIGRKLAETLGYLSKDLDKIPQQAVDSFAGVGYHFDLAKIRNGESVLDLGSGSGMDSFVAGLRVGSRGKVVGIDMTDAQLEKASKLRDRMGARNVEFKKGYIEKLPFVDSSFDVVISNGVINLSAQKEKVFEEAVRVLKVGGRLAISDIVTEKELSEEITCDSTLWAACIGGAEQEDKYRNAMEKAGLYIVTIKQNPKYRFLTEGAKAATEEYGVKSVSLLAEKPRR